MPFDGKLPGETVGDKARLLLLVAADLIKEPDRWCQGKLRDGNRYCAVGAVETAHWRDNTGNRSGMYRAARALEAVARARGYRDIVSLNDSFATTHADVLAAFREAAELAGR